MHKKYTIFRKAEGRINWKMNYCFALAFFRSWVIQCHLCRSYVWCILNICLQHFFASINKSLLLSVSQIMRNLTRKNYCTYKCWCNILLMPVILMKKKPNFSVCHTTILLYIGPLIAWIFSGQQAILGDLYGIRPTEIFTSKFHVLPEMHFSSYCKHDESRSND